MRYIQKWQISTYRKVWYFANATSPTSVPSFMIFMAFMMRFSIVYWISLNCWLLSSFHFFQSSEASYVYFGQLAWKEPPKMATKRGKITYCGIKIVTFKSSETKISDAKGSLARFAHKIPQKLFMNWIVQKLRFPISLRKYFFTQRNLDSMRLIWVVFKHCALSDSRVSREQKEPLKVSIR